MVRLTYLLGDVVQAPDGSSVGSQTFAEGVEWSKQIAETWTALWQRTLDVGAGDKVIDFGSKLIYAQLCEVGALFSTGLLIFLAIRQLKVFMEGNYYEYFLGMIFPLIVTLLLSNNGLLLREITFELRSYINAVNFAILEGSVSGANLNEVYQTYLASASEDFVFGNLTAQCQVLPDARSQEACIEEALDMLYGVTDVDAESSERSDDSSNDDSLTETVGKAASMAADKARWFLFPGGPGVALGAIGTVETTQWVNHQTPIFSNAAEGILFQTMNAFQGGYQQMLELTLLLTALLGPLAVGGGLMTLGGNWGANSMFAFIIAFFTVGFAKICFNLIVGLAAVFNTTASSADPLPLATLSGFYAPLLSAALAAGGGLSVWQAITSAAATTVRTAASIGTGMVSGAVGSMGKMAGKFF